MVLLHEAVAKNSLEKVQTLIDNKADINESILYLQGTPLHIAALNGYENIAKLLISNGA